MLYIKIYGRGDDDGCDYDCPYCGSTATVNDGGGSCPNPDCDSNN